MRKPCCDKRGNNKGAWSTEEDQKLIDYIQTHGEGCWRSIPEAAGRLPGRTDNEVKNYWNSHLKKKLINMGIDPNNHRLNQILPRLQAEPAAPVIATSTTTGSKNNVAASKPNNLSDGDSDRVSDTATCLEDDYESLVTQQAATSGSSSIDIDLNIAAPASPGHRTTFENKQQNCKWGKTSQVERGPSSLPTLLLFR
ncbi:hypothetical protein D5086_008440 [Populus alba]|uniref:Uncharacterized protein n=1 Tax=Populus alba TaxID=43335 RepID=A0ACC4CFZ1_POPAL